MFTQPVSMIVNEGQSKVLCDKLLKLGYSLVRQSRYEDNNSLLVTDLAFHNNECGFTHSSDSKREFRYFIEEYNEELFLALAAMTDNKYGIKGEYWCRKTAGNSNFPENKLYKQFSLNEKRFYKTILFDKDGVKRSILDINITNQFRKATKEELIKHFTISQNIKEVMKEQTKDLPTLRSGNIVELKDSERGLVVQGSDNTLVIYWDYNEKGYKSLSTLENYILKSIEKVYSGISKYNRSAGLSNFITKGEAMGNLIWTKPTTVVLTLQEIADKFGVDSKYLQIKEYQE